MVRQGSRTARFGMIGCLGMLAALMAAACAPGPTPSPIYITPGPTMTPVIVSIAPEPTAAPDATPTAAPDATPTATPDATPTAAPTPTPVPVAPTIATTTITESGTARCGGWTVTFKKPVVSGVASAAALNAIIETRVKDIIANFKSDLPSGGTAGPCTLAGKYTVSLVSPRLLSLRFSMLAYLGGANDTQIASSLNFLVSTGALINLADLFSNLPSALNVMSTRSRALLPLLPEMDGIDASWINPGTTPLIGNFDSAWAMSGTGLAITFAELQVAPVPGGTPTITIKWADLKTVINPAGPAAEFAH